MLKLFVLYIILLNGIAIVCGYLISCIHIQVMEYVLLVIGSAYFSLLEFQLLQDCVQIGGVSDFLHIFAIGKDFTMHYGTLLPVEAHFMAKQVAILCMLIVLCSLICIVRKKEYKVLALTVTMSVAGVVCLYAWRQPVSGYYAGYDRDYDIAAEEPVSMEEEMTSDFFVKSYQMNLTVDSMLKAEVEMVLSDAELSQYVFTLYSCYDIKSVTDGEGNALAYDREGNRLIITAGAVPVEAVRISYAGVGFADFFSGEQGIYLPGNFAYYPIAGCRVENAMHLCEPAENISLYDVMVNDDRKVYSNLDGSANHVHGYSNNLTLIAGCWNEETVDGVTYLYPKYIKNAGFSNEKFMRTIQDVRNAKAAENGNYTLRDKKIIFSPVLHEGNRYLFGSDVVLVSDAYELLVEYQHYVETGEYYMDEEEAVERRRELWEEGN